MAQLNSAFCKGAKLENLAAKRQISDLPFLFLKMHVVTAELF